MPYTDPSLAIRPLPFKPPKLRHFSRRQFDTHYEVLYGDAVRRLGARLTTADPSAAALRDLDEIHLHEYFLESLTEGNPGEPSAAWLQTIEAKFGDFDGWRSVLYSLAEDTPRDDRAGAGRGLALLWSTRLGRLFFSPVSEHGLPHATDVILLLYLDPIAIADDFDASTRAYVDAFLDNLNWHVVNDRFAAAMKHDMEAIEASVPEGTTTVELLANDAGKSSAALVLDVRLEDDVDQTRIAGSTWRDPTTVETWAGALPTDRPVVVYCVYGGWVSKDTVAALRERGIDATLLRGGISSWRALELPVDPVLG